MKTNIRELERKSIYQGRVFRLESVRLQGPNKREFEHQVIRHPGAAVIVPQLDQDLFVLVRQFRSPIKKVLWEFPAGTLESNESPLACAKREIAEETGYEAKRWKKLARFYPEPGISTELMHLYLACDLKPAPRELDMDEFLERKVLSFQRLREMILNGTIEDAKTMLGFFYLCEYLKRPKCSSRAA